jgi:para-nitrobenzyl esterase
MEMAMFAKQSLAWAQRLGRRLVWMAWSSLCLGLSAHAHAQAATTDLLFQTDAGLIQGLSVAKARVYLGVPYAAPPTGAGRWQAPRPVAPWGAQVRPAQQAGPACPQLPSVILSAPSVNEDCLYLNVHVPKAASASDRLPVMVWLHGGAFANGTAASYDASEWADRGQVVVVTVNYRLGALGFLAHPALKAAESALNFGLQDQQAALRWVQRNIAGLGGDPDRVTLFGQSAGAASVCLNLTSPMAAGLFHRAILHSGGCDSAWVAMPLAKAYATGEDLAQQLGCAKAGDVMACLRGKSVDDLLHFVPSGPPLPSDPPTPWAGVVDGVVVPKVPLDIIKANGARKMPVMLGVNQNEGGLFVALQYDIGLGRPMTESDLQTALIAYGNGASGATLLKSIYSTKAYKTPSRALGALQTDAVFACLAHRLAQTFAGKGFPTYAYHFEDAAAPSLLTAPVSSMGAYHVAELQYLFDLGTWATMDARQHDLRQQMMAHWAQFAATGNPNGQGLANWPRFNALTSSYLRLRTSGAGTLSLGAYQAQHQCVLWNLLTALAPKT